MRKRKDYINGTGTGSAAKDDEEGKFFKKYMHISFLENTSIVERRCLSNTENLSEQQAENDGNIQENSETDADNIEETENMENQSDAQEDINNDKNESQPNLDNSNSNYATPSISKKRKIATASSTRDSVVVQELKKGRMERTAILKDILSSQTRQLPEDDSITLFFRSLAATVSQFSPRLIAKAKLEIMKVITQLELEHLGNVPEFLGYGNDIRIRIPATQMNEDIHESFSRPSTSASHSVESPVSYIFEDLTNALDI